MSEVFRDRSDGRDPDQLRQVRITPKYLKTPLGSALIEMGDTKVICTVSHEERVPPFLLGKGKGWLTAEYSMLPRSTHTRSQREAARGKQGGRTMEIQRLIAHSALPSWVKTNAIAVFTELAEAVSERSGRAPDDVEEVRGVSSNSEADLLMSDWSIATTCSGIYD